MSRVGFYTGPSRRRSHRLRSPGRRSANARLARARRMVATLFPCPGHGGSPRSSRGRGCTDQARAATRWPGGILVRPDMLPGETEPRGRVRQRRRSTCAARTYAADVYTISTGASEGGCATNPKRVGRFGWTTPRRSCTCCGSSTAACSQSPTQGCRPGEYNQQHSPRERSADPGGGDVELNQVVRQAIAVVITVPGLRSRRSQSVAPSTRSLGSRSSLSLSRTPAISA